MASTRPYALVLTLDQWLRAAHEGTALDEQDRCVELAWTSDSKEASNPPEPGPAGGLAFDSACRLYRAADGRVERVLWAAQDPLQQRAAQPAPIDVIGDVEPELPGDFAPVPHAHGPLSALRGLVIDDADRLFIAEAGKSRILVFDLWTRRLVRTVHLAATPIALAALGGAVLVLTEGPAGLFTLAAHGTLRPLPLEGAVSPARVAVSPSGRVAILDPGAGKILLRGEDFAPAAPPHATDLAFETDDVIIVAKRPGEDFVRIPVGPPEERVDQPALKARGYDGLGIVRTPDGRIGFWTAQGFRHAVTVRRRYQVSGTVTTFQLDSGEWQTTWGRIFIDACIPEGAEVRVRCVAADEIPEGLPLPRTPPSNVGAAVVPYPDLSPPMPPLALVPDDARFFPIHRRESGRELPWAQPLAGDRFVTYEAPIQADAGRFLWVTLELSGNTRVSPRVRCVRAEHPSHDYLRRLPRTFSRDAGAASFLLRYLAIFEGFLGEIDARGAERGALLDPRAAPDELLPWLASFLGLVLDGRWPNDRQRTLIAEIADLWRARGTLRGLTRMLEIYLGVPPTLIEHFRLPGPGGAILGVAGGSIPAAVVGSTFRVGGALASGPRDASAPPAPDPTATHAHRFTVVIPGALDDEQRAVVTDIIEAHKPAHTLYDVCTVAGGVRLGPGLHVGISTLVGRGAAFVPARVGGWVLGRGGTVGRAERGTTAGTSRLGKGTRV